MYPFGEAISMDVSKSSQLCSMKKKKKSKNPIVPFCDVSRVFVQIKNLVLVSKKTKFINQIVLLKVLL